MTARRQSRVTAAVGSDDLLAVLAGMSIALAVLPLGFAGHLQPWMVVVVVILALVVGARHGSAEGLVGELLVVFMWLVSRPDPVSAWTPVLALLLLVNHMSLALLESAPPGAPFGRDVVRRWLGQGAVVAAVTLAAFGGTALVRNLDVTGSVLIVAAGLFFFAVMILVLRSDALADSPAVDEVRPPYPAPEREGARWA